MFRIHPCRDGGKQFVLVPAEASGRELVARCPVVHEGEEALHLVEAATEVLHRREDEGVQLVLVEGRVGQGGDKRFRLAALQQLLGQAAEEGRPHADDAFRGDVREQFPLECSIAVIG